MFKPRKSQFKARVPFQSLTDEEFEKARTSFIRSVLREASVRWPGRTIADRNASVGFGQRRCAQCKKIVMAKKRKLDHIDPVVDPTVGFINWHVFIMRLLTRAEGFQVLCIPCHDQKSREETKLAVERRKLEKAKLPPKEKKPRKHADKTEPVDET